MSNINITLKVWRQKNGKSKGQLVTYKVPNVSTHASFLEMLDVLNEDLISKNDDPISFGHDCREGICGSCGLYINGRAHGPDQGIATCQLHMRTFKDGDTIVVEPWRARAFPIIKDLVVDRSALDRIAQAGGYISVNTGGARDANEILVPKEAADEAFSAAECIGCGACVAACPNASAMLFTSAMVSHLSLMPQGKPERARRVEAMVDQMDAEGFGNCSNVGACTEECPKGIGQHHIARMNREFMAAKLVHGTNTSATEFAG
jgi:succinate dehydrogenase / fumarate reductase iron-sulfur subunit